MTTFNEKLRAKWKEGRFVCVGLDSEFEKIPERVHRASPTKRETIVSFNRAIVAATKKIVCAYKPNLAFYANHGPWGIQALTETIEYVHEVAPDVPVILDAKVADIGNTNRGYVNMAFENLGADAITVHPYLGQEALQPFLAQAGKGIIVLCKTSNSGAGEFQDLPVPIPEDCLEEMFAENPVLREQLSDVVWPLYQHVAYQVAKAWNGNDNCMVVVGATYPEELVQVRRIVGDMPILIPGIGAQGGDVESTVKAGMDSHGQGMIINSSRGIIFASNGPDFAEAARREALKLNDLINQYRN